MNSGERSGEKAALGSLKKARKIRPLSDILSNEGAGSTIYEDFYDASDSVKTGQTAEDGRESSESESEGAPATVTVANRGFCVECVDQKADVFCETCNEDFCQVCAGMIHRTGGRALHRFKNVETGARTRLGRPGRASDVAPRNDAVAKPEADTASTTDMELSQADGGDYNEEDTMDDQERTSSAQVLAERCQYIPMRLEAPERRALRLIEAALNVSEYTEKVDIYGLGGQKSKRIVQQIKDICAILLGLVVASDFQTGQALLKEKNFDDNAEFFQILFEIGRRYKIMNPDRMRSSYGKLMYLLQDACLPEIEESLGFECRKPINTVYNFLESKGIANMLKEERIHVATMEINPSGKSRFDIQKEIRRKEAAIEVLARKYSSKGNNVTSDQVRTALYSIGDNHTYLRACCDPCDRMLGYLTEYFDPHAPEKGFELSIHFGSNGARLSHSHELQYHYVRQTLSLWREILDDMFRLWYLADKDLLSSDVRYRLVNTGQGLNRVQPCPAVSRAMHTILHRAQLRARHWVGSSVIHLGDHNVPNALMFIDKYNQVPRILNPLIRVLDNIERLTKTDAGIKLYINNRFGGTEEVYKDDPCRLFPISI